MSNGINAPFGLQVVESGVGNGGTQKLKAYRIYADANGANTQATSIFCGDPVKFCSSPALAALSGTIVPEYLNSAAIAPVPAAAAADAFLGVFISCSYIPVSASSGSNPVVESSYWPGGTLVKPGTPIIAYVNDDPTAIFRVQVSSILANENGITYTSVQNGLNANLGVGGVTFTGDNASQPNPLLGNVNSGQSAYYLDGNSIANTATLDVKIIGIAPDVTLNQNPNNLIPGINMPFINVLVRFNKHMYGSGGVAGPTAGA